MKIDTYNKAKDLIDDMKRIEKQVTEFYKDNHWIRISTPNYPDSQYSVRVQKELVEWLMSKKEEYQREFDRLT